MNLPEFYYISWYKRCHQFSITTLFPKYNFPQIFSELDELVFERGENVWEEKARWMKFEQVSLFGINFPKFLEFNLVTLSNN